MTRDHRDDHDLVHLGHPQSVEVEVAPRAPTVTNAAAALAAAAARAAGMDHDHAPELQKKFIGGGDGAEPAPTADPPHASDDDAETQLPSGAHGRSGVPAPRWGHEAEDAPWLGRARYEALGFGDPDRTCTWLRDGAHRATSTIAEGAGWTREGPR